MRLRLARKPHLSIEDIEREAAAEIERRISMGKPPPEEWKGVASLDAGMFGPGTPPAPPAEGEGEAAPALEPPGTAARPVPAGRPAARARARPKAPPVSAKSPAVSAKATTAKTTATKAASKVAKAPAKTATRATARRAR